MIHNKQLLVVDSRVDMITNCDDNQLIRVSVVIVSTLPPAPLGHHVAPQDWYAMVVATTVRSSLY